MSPLLIKMAANLPFSSDQGGDDFNCYLILPYIILAVTWNRRSWYTGIALFINNANGKMRYRNSHNFL